MQPANSPDQAHRDMALVSGEGFYVRGNDNDTSW